MRPIGCKMQAVARAIPGSFQGIPVDMATGVRACRRMAMQAPFSATTFWPRSALMARLPEAGRAYQLPRRLVSGKLRPDHNSSFRRQSRESLTSPRQIGSVGTRL